MKRSDSYGFMIVLGRPGRSCRVIGPFRNEQRAIKYANICFQNRAYAVVEIEEPTATPKFWNIPSESDIDKEYIVRLDTNGIWTCSCPDHMYRLKDCKHIMKAQVEYFGVLT